MTARDHDQDQRAAVAERAVLARHLRPLWGLPGTVLGVVNWPTGPADRAHVRWHFWWQAHLLDCLVDAQLRAPDRRRQRQLTALVRGVLLRNLGRWTNDYYDDMAWLGLALLRAGAAGLERHRAVAVLAGQVFAAAQAPPTVALPWRRGDTYRNAPANGPAGLLLARLGELEPAQAISDWMDATLVDPRTGLVLDGVRDGEEPDRALYTYCQGVVLALETELAVRTGQPRHAARVCRLVDAVAQHMAPGGVLQGCGTGDGGLFAGITARYLAVVADRLPGDSEEHRRARAVAARTVQASARAAWDHRAVLSSGLPRFGSDWSAQAGAPPPDLSVQLSAWMLLEAQAHLRA